MVVWISFSLNVYNKVKKFMGPGRRYGGGMAANMDLDYEDAHTGLDAHGSACDPLATFVWFLFFPIFAFNISQPESRDMEGAQDNTVAEIQRDAEKWSLRSYFSTMFAFDLPLLIINILAMSLTGGFTFGSVVAFGRAREGQCAVPELPPGKKYASFDFSSLIRFLINLF